MFDVVFQAMLLMSFFLHPKNINISFLLINYSHCKQALLEGALAAGRKRKLRRACNYISGISISPPIPLSELSDFHQSAQSGKCE